MEPDDYWADDEPQRSGCFIKGVVSALALALVASLAVWFLGDRLARPRIERAVAKQLVRDYGLPTEPTVHLDGSPFLVKAASGSIDRATVQMSRFTSDGFTVSSADVVAEGLRFNAGEVVRGTGDMTADTVTATVRVTAADLSAYLQSRGLPVTLSAEGSNATVSGQVSALGVTAKGTATGTITLVGSTLAFTPETVAVEGVNVPLPKAITDAAFAFRVAIPEVAGMTIRSARIVNGELECEATATNYVLNRTR
jgi:hypothetical protein